MKKSRFFTLALLGASLIFASSCSKDDDVDPIGPSLIVTESLSGSTGGDIEITQGEPLVFMWEAREGDGNLDVFAVSQTGANAEVSVLTTYSGHELPYEVSGDDKDIYIDTLAFNNAGTTLGTTNYTFSVTDVDGLSSSVSFNVTVVEAESNIELTEPLAFAWTRVGGNPGTELSQFGLEWTQNSSTSAIVAIDAATTMVNLGSAAWTTLATQGDLDAAIADATPITEYTGVSATVDGTYDDVLGVTYDGVDYLIHVTNGTVSTGSAGTTIVISGMYKK